MKISGIFRYLNNGNRRSVIVKRNILAQTALQGINVLVSLQVVPLTIGYVNPEKYGIWLTLSSIISWIGYFDFGLAHGFRNRFAETKAKGDMKLAKEYVSTTYAVLFIIFFLICVIICFANLFLDWSRILKVDPSYSSELQIVFGLLTLFFSINIVAKVFTTMLHADLNTAFATFVQTAGNVLALLVIYILTKCTDGSLLWLSISFSGIPCLFLIIVSIITFSTTKYRCFAPSISSVRFSLTRKIIGLGGQFFIIMFSTLLIYQFLNVIISRIQGSVAVTEYNIAHKYFNVLSMLVMIVMTPLWSAFTDAYTKKDFLWMKNVVKKLEIMWLLCIPITILMLLCSNFFYNWWIGDDVNISLSLSACTAIYILFQSCGNVYMYIINGIGKVRLQLIIYMFFSFVSLPLIQFFCIKLGTEGALLVPTGVYIIQAFVGRIQIHKIIDNTATGIWLK